MNRVGRKKGFTLLEIMVSVTILLLMVLMISRIFSASTQAIEHGKGQALLDETARFLLDVVERDISQALIRTDVAFRVQELAGNRALYFASTGVRHRTETIPRDIAPMRLSTSFGSSVAVGLVADLNRLVLVESALGTAGTVDRLTRSSDYYFLFATQTVDDFMSIIANTGMSKGSPAYTSPLEGTSGTENHAALSFMYILINGDPDSNLTPDLPPDPTDMPRYVDVTIGLVPSIEMAQAMRLYNAQGEARGMDYLAKREKIYTRRIFLRNTGIAPFTY